MAEYDPGVKKILFILLWDKSATIYIIFCMDGSHFFCESMIFSIFIRAVSLFIVDDFGIYFCEFGGLV
jgi:hypothetical protein